MSARNPYNASRPGNLFTGHERLRRRVIDGLADGRSYAITGGRRCGKTSLLIQIAEDLEKESGSTAKFLPRIFDVQGEVPHSPMEFFSSIAKRLVQGTTVPAWNAANDVQQPYSAFLGWAQGIGGQMAAHHGPDWVCVLLIDELEVAAQYLPDDECFHNLRHLLMTSPLTSRIRVIVSGVGGLSHLTSKGSPLNNLEPEWLGALPAADAKELISRGFAGVSLAEAEAQVLALSGGHPWILQGLLGYLWEERDAITGDAIADAAARFVRNRDDVFANWVKAFGKGGKAAFGAIARASSQGLAIADLRASLPKEATVDSTLRVLLYHGVAHETSVHRTHVNGEIFSQWFLQNVSFIDDDAPVRSGAPIVAKEESEVRKKRVFIVFGRDRKLYSAVVRFLRAVKLEVVEFNDALEATGNASATIKEVIEEAFKMAQAVIVLLTPDDEARLRPVFHGPQEPPHEKELTPQPRPNVLFEAGFAMARFPNATILVRFDRTTRLFSDIGGVFLLDLDNSFASRERFIQRLKICGLDVDDTGTEWHSERHGGDFTPAQQ